MQSGMPWWVGVSAGLASGLAVGVLNAAAISYLRINSIITTLATMSIVRGAVYIYTEGRRSMWTTVRCSGLARDGSLGCQYR